MHRLRRFCRLCAGPLLSGLLAACMAGPDFHRPDTLQAPAPLAPQPQWQAWWQALAWPQLEPLMAAAMAGNRDLRVAESRWTQSLAQAGASAGGQWPTLDAGADTGRQKYGAKFLGPDDIPAFRYWAITATADWVLDLAGGAQRAAERDRALAEYRRRKLDEAYLTVTGNIALQATAVASARAQLDYAQALLDCDTKLLELVQHAYDAGDVSQLSVLDARRQLARDRTRLPPMRRALSEAGHALAVLTGAPADTWRVPDLAFDSPSEFAPSEIAAVAPIDSESLRVRPDIGAAEAQLHAATAALGVATADLYPRLSLSASFGPQSIQADDLFDESSLASTLMGGVTMPLFHGGTLRARRDAAQAALQASLAQYEQAILQSFAQVADLLAALEQDAALLEAERAAGEAATARRQLAELGHAAGNTGIRPVLEAERGKLIAHIEYTNSIAQQRADTILLLLALGGRELPSE